MKKLINVRIPLFCAMGLILGIISCHKQLCGNFYFGVILLVLLVVGLVITAVFKRSYQVFAVLLAFAFVGFGIAQLSYHTMEGNEAIEREVVLQGRVCDVGRNGESLGPTYYLESCVDLSSGEKLKGRVRITYFNYDDLALEVGEVVTVAGTMYSTYPVKTSVQSYYVRNRVYFELSNSTLQDRKAGKLKFDETVRRYVYETAMEFAPENGGIIYALLTGDRNAIPDDVVDNFQRAGTIHLLAVSGLHVGFIVAVICFVLKRLRLKPLVECAIVSVPLLFYAYVCGFSPSILRALAMTVCLYLSRAVLGRYDLLTSLSISAIIVLFPTPYALFDVGFQLSFLSIFGIATLHTPIMRLLAKRKINKFAKYLLNAFLLSLSCSLATLFTLAVNYGQVPLLGVFVNLVAIPLVSVIFVISIFGMLPWFFHYLLVASDKLLVALVWCNEQVSNLSFATASISALAISVAIAAVLLFVLGGFVNLNKLGKRISCAVCALLLAATVVATLVPRRAENRAYVSFGYGNSVVAAISDEGEAVLVGDFSDVSATTFAVRFLSKYRVENCTLFATDYSRAVGASVRAALNALPVDKVYTLTKATNDSITQIFEQNGVSVVSQMPNTTVGASVTVRSIYDGGLVAVNVNVLQIDVCLVTSNRGSLLQIWNRADLYVLGNGVDVDKFAQADFTTFSSYQTNFAHNYGANKYGNFTIKQKDDRIIFNFS